MNIRVILIGLVVMVLLVAFLPDIDYDSYFRFQAAHNMGFSLLYIRSLIWLPLYQYVSAFFNNFVLLRLFSVLCVSATSELIKRMKCVDESVAVATSVLYLANPFILLYGSQATSESFATFLMMGFIVLFCRQKHFFASLVLTGGVLTAYFFWVFIPFILVFGLMNRKKIFATYLLPVIAVALWGYLNYTIAHEPLNFLNLASKFYEYIATKFSMRQTSTKLLLFPLVYPFMFALPFAVHAIRRKITCMTVDLKVLITYFVISYTALLVMGQALGYVFSWSRYFIPLIPAYLILGCEGVLMSKRKQLWIISYFFLALAMTIIQASEAYTFKVWMSQR